MRDIDNLLKEGIAAVKAGQCTRARALLKEVLRQRPRDITAWLWLSGAVGTDDERRQCLERVLEIEPNNPHAKKGLQRLSPRIAPSQRVLTTVPATIKKPPTTSPIVSIESPLKAAPPVTPAHPPASVLLDQEAAWLTRHGWEIISRTETAIQARKKKQWNRTLLILGAVLLIVFGIGLGLWLLALVDYLLKSDEIRYVTVEQLKRRRLEARRRAEAQATASSDTTHYPRERKGKKQQRNRWLLAILGVLFFLCICVFGWFLVSGISTPGAVNPPLGTRAPTTTRTPTPMEVLEWQGVYIGMPADDVLKLHPKSETTEEPVVIGSDPEGLIVRWSYPDAHLILARRDGEGTDSLGFSVCYRVIEIQLR